MAHAATVVRLSRMKRMGFIALGWDGASSLQPAEARPVDPTEDHNRNGPYDRGKSKSRHNCYRQIIRYSHKITNFAIFPRGRGFFSVTFIAKP